MTLNQAWNALRRLELRIPVEIVGPTFMEIVGRKLTAVLLQRPGRRLVGVSAREHATFSRQPVALAQVAGRAGGADVRPHRAAAARARDQMVEGEMLGRAV